MAVTEPDILWAGGKGSVLGLMTGMGGRHQQSSSGCFFLNSAPASLAPQRQPLTRPVQNSC